MDKRMRHDMSAFRVSGMAIRYSQFVPKLYNYCLALGFDRARIMPSRAFCSDESQGYPIILLAQHFGTFPFDHGVVGGRVATDRHGPHAHHGEDLVIVQASHVGYDATTQKFGVYQRKRTNSGDFGANCGKLSAILSWYQAAYDNGGQSVQFGLIDNLPVIYIDNELLDENRSDGLFLRLERLIDGAKPLPVKVLSTSKAFPASAIVQEILRDVEWEETKKPFGRRLAADLFFFKRQPVVGPEGLDQLERAIAPAMHLLVTSANPQLDAARYHTQTEFDRVYRTIQCEPAYVGKNVLFVSGLNIDVSPDPKLLFPLTKFVPWAAYIQLRDGKSFVLEQDALFDALSTQPPENKDEVAFDLAIRTMAQVESIELPIV
jgi:hypothetical protein